MTRAAWHSNVIQTELMARGIPFDVIGGIKFAERAHVKDIIAFLRIIINHIDAISWHRILQLIDGIGNVRATEIITSINKKNGIIELSLIHICLKVFFGEIPVPEENVQVVDYKTILVVTPPHAPGSVEVKVENPDGELSSPNGIFTYLSSPKISAVVDPNDPTETIRITRISVEGGQKVKIKGTAFTAGARVVRCV